MARIKRSGDVMRVHSGTYLLSLTSVVCSLGADGGVFQENEAKHEGSYLMLTISLCKCTPCLFIPTVTFFSNPARIFYIILRE